MNGAQHDTGACQSRIQGASALRDQPRALQYLALLSKPIEAQLSFRHADIGGRERRIDRGSGFEFLKGPFEIPGAIPAV